MASPHCKDCVLVCVAQTVLLTKSFLLLVLLLQPVRSRAIPSSVLPSVSMVSGHFCLWCRERCQDCTCADICDCDLESDGGQEYKTPATPSDDFGQCGKMAPMTPPAKMFGVYETPATPSDDFGPYGKITPMTPPAKLFRVYGADTSHDEAEVDWGSPSPSCAESSSPAVPSDDEGETESHGMVEATAVGFAMPTHDKGDIDGHGMVAGLSAKATAVGCLDVQCAVRSFSKWKYAGRRPTAGLMLGLPW